MENRIPKYLRNIAEFEKFQNNELQIKIKCECGNKTFIISKNLNTEQDNELEKQLQIKSKIYDEFYRDPYDKKGYWVKRNFFGKIVEKIDQSEMAEKSCAKIIKGKCSTCGKEHIIFDSRLYGYDGVIKEHRSFDYNDIKFLRIKIKSCVQPVKISVKVVYDLSFQEFIDFVGESFNQNDYSNAFSSINIYAEMQNKKVLIFAEETA